MTARPAQRDTGLEGFELVVGGRAAHGPRLRPWLVFIFVVIAAFFGLIVSRISLDQSAFVLDELEGQIAEAEALHWDLRLEVARLQDPERISAAARDMGLVFPQERHALDAPAVEEDGLEPEHRWAQLKALLSAHP